MVTVLKNDDIVWVRSLGREKPWPARLSKHDGVGFTVEYLNTKDWDYVPLSESRVFPFKEHYQEMRTLAAKLRAPKAWEGALLEACSQLLCQAGREAEVTPIRLAGWRYERELRAFLGLLGIEVNPVPLLEHEEPQHLVQATRKKKTKKTEDNTHVVGIFDSVESSSGWFPGGSSDRPPAEAPFPAPPRLQIGKRSSEVLEEDEDDVDYDQIQSSPSSESVIARAERSFPPGDEVDAGYAYVFSHGRVRAAWSKEWDTLEPKRKDELVGLFQRGKEGWRPPQQAPPPPAPVAAAMSDVEQLSFDFSETTGATAETTAGLVYQSDDLANTSSLDHLNLLQGPISSPR